MTAARYDFSMSATVKGKKLLKRKTYRLASQLPPFPDEERRALARACLDNGATANRNQLTALAQAKLAYVREVLDICARFRCRAFASILLQHSPSALPKDMLRRDYCYLFERFFYFLEDRDPDISGIVVFDELENLKTIYSLDKWTDILSALSKVDNAQDKSFQNPSLCIQISRQVSSLPTSSRISCPGDIEKSA